MTLSANRTLIIFNMLTEILDGLVKLLGPIATLSKDQRELKDLALRTISNALHETASYYAELGRGNERSSEREALLSKYWSAAAIPLRHFDENLAISCDEKSVYWINPDGYSEQNIQQLGIKLVDIRTAYRKMLSPNSTLYKSR